MSIFQKSVINKHLVNLDKGQVEKAYQKFRENYNSAKIEEIKKLKEEQYQDGFLRDIFVDVFGYVLAPDENHNLAREFKNIADSKKADGAILKDGKAIAVIELKSTKTKDLKSVTEQAFGYKHNQPDCKYVIISNFQKLQFFIDYANEYEEFDLFHLQKDEFELLYLLLNSESIFADLPLKLKTETKFHEENVSNQLYKDYSLFKRKLFDNLIKNNPQHDKLTLFKKSQKLLDRFLFILFAEDSGLLPPNSITRIIDKYNLLIELDEYKAIYEIYKQYFGYMNVGRKGKTEADKIPAYNGGLFYPDELLDSLIIDDDILISDLLKLSEYDFNTEVDVNILGHIFEHSLNEIEEITAEIEGTATDKKKSKRKKDGVFYTPKYITQYIVENTVGTLCKEKREEFGIAEIEFDGTFKTKDGKLSVKGKKLFETLEKYKEWLLTLKIVDPACGSGAFLNQALNFLIAEHKSIDDIIAELTNTPLRLFDTEKSILENNLYGVDINEESVEIAKLSLWLRTARKDRKLSNLNSNIKCGNSLIDDPEVAGDKAFNWNKEFPQIFKKKKKQVWHITTATHNSRFSQRMFDYHIKTGEAVWIDEKDEIVITKAIAEIIKEDNLNIIEYNICGDHLHMLLVCEKEEVPKIVGKIKAVTARKYNIEKGITSPSSIPTSMPPSMPTTATRGQVPLSREDEPLSSGKKKYNSLWTQKFGNSLIKDEEYLRNAINYIHNNRKKHELPENKELQKITESMTCSVEHAFRTEYCGGFDVVMGNPPYGSLLSTHTKEYIAANYICFKGNFDIYSAFIQLAFQLCKINSFWSFINPVSWQSGENYINVRRYLSENGRLEVGIKLPYNIFEDAYVDTGVYIVRNSKTKSYTTSVYEFPVKFKYNGDLTTDVYLQQLPNSYWTSLESLKIVLNPSFYELLPKVFNNSIALNDITNSIRGVLPNKEDVSSEPKISDKLYFMGGLYRYNIINDFQGLNYGAHLKEKPKDYSFFQGERILIRRLINRQFRIMATLVNNEFVNKKDLYNLKITDERFDLKFLLAIINSKLISYLKIKGATTATKDDFGQLTLSDIRHIPIKFVEKKGQEPFIENVNKILELNKQFQQKKNEFLSRVKDNFAATAATRGHVPLAIRITKKLDTFYDFDFKIFVAELKKQKVAISLTEQVEWEEFFNSYKKELNNLQSEIDKTDKEIDQMVYELYGLTEEEIEIVEGAV